MLYSSAAFICVFVGAYIFVYIYICTLYLFICIYVLVYVYMYVCVFFSLPCIGEIKWIYWVNQVRRCAAGLTNVEEKQAWILSFK